MLLKQQQEQLQELQKTSRKASQSGFNLKSRSLTHLIDGGRQQMEGNLQIVSNSLKNQMIYSSYQQQQQQHHHSKGGSGDSFNRSSEFANSNSPLSSEAQMKFNLLKMSLSSDAGYADDASPASSTTSASEASEADQFLLGNVVEVKAVDELPEEISELLCHASYPDGVSGGLTRNGKGKPPLETSLSCPSEPAAQPKYRGGRKKEAPPANMTAEQRVQWEKERQKKDNHNDIERRRRDKINECIRLLALIVPNGDDSTSFLDESGSLDAQKKEYNKKGAVLEAAVNYIKRLQSEQKQMEEYRQQQEILQRANRTLLLEIQQLQSRAKQVHISSPHLSPPVQVQQVMLHQQYQPQFEPRSSLNQDHLQQTDMHLGSVPMLIVPGQTQVQHIEIQQQQQHLAQDEQNLFFDDLVNFVQESSSNCPPLVTGGGCHFDAAQFETISENVFLDEPENGFPDVSLMDHGFINIIPEQVVAIGDYNVDEFFNVQSVQLNGDPLLSNATDEPMASDFDDLFIPLVLR